MRPNFLAIVFVCCLAHGRCRLISGDYLRREQAGGKTEEGRAEDGVKYIGRRSEVGVGVPERALATHDPNVVTEALGPSPIVKQKRCCPSPRLGSSNKLIPEPTVRLGTPLDIERRDLQSQITKRLCTSCMARQSCQVHQRCEMCTRWCTSEELSSGTTQNSIENTITTDTPIVGATQQRTEEPKVSLASRFGDSDKELNNNKDEDKEELKRVYPIATLQSGQTKKVICQLLGISDPSDIQTLVVWVTTHSNHPPKFGPGYRKRVKPEVELLVKQFNDELEKALERKKEERGENYLTEDEIRHVMNMVQSNNQNLAQRNGEERSNWSEDFLPIFAIDPDGMEADLPRVLNPDVIEDTPDMRLVGAEKEKILESRIGEIDASPTDNGNQLMGSREAGTGMVGAGTLGSTVTEIVSVTPTTMTEKSIEENLPRHSTQEPLIVSPIAPDSDENLGLAATQDQMKAQTRGGEDTDALRTNKVKPEIKTKKVGKIEGGPAYSSKTYEANEKLGESIVGEPVDKQTEKNVIPDFKSIEPATRGQKNTGDTSLSTRIKSPGDDELGSNKVGDENQDLAKPTTDAVEQVTQTTDKTIVPLKSRTQSLLEKIREKIDQRMKGPLSISQKEKEDERIGSTIREDGSGTNVDSKSTPSAVIETTTKVGQGTGSDLFRPTDVADHNGQELIRNLPTSHGSQSPSVIVDNLEAAKIALEDVKKLVEEIQKDTNIEQDNGLLGDQQEVGMTSPNTITTDKNGISRLQTTPTPVVSIGNNVEPGRVIGGVKKLSQNVSDKSKQEIKIVEDDSGVKLGPAPEGGEKIASEDVIGSQPLEEVVSNGDFGHPMIKIPDPRTNKERENLGSPQITIKGVDDTPATSFKFVTVPQGSMGKDQVTYLSWPKKNPGKATFVFQDNKGFTPARTSTQKAMMNRVYSSATSSPVPSGSIAKDPNSSKIVSNNDIAIFPDDRSILKDSQTEQRMEEERTTADILPQDNDQLTLGQQSLDASREPVEDRIALTTRGEFPGETDNLGQQSWSNSLGSIIPSQQESNVGSSQPKDIFFIGNGIKLPLQMVRKDDGALHLSVDLDKLCSCKNTSCPKNHSTIVETVGTILEKEAELKDQLADADFKDIPVGMASPKLVSRSSRASAKKGIVRRIQRGIVDNNFRGSLYNKQFSGNGGDSKGLTEQSELKISDKKMMPPSGGLDTKGVDSLINLQGSTKSNADKATDSMENDLKNTKLDEKSNLSPLLFQRLMNQKITKLKSRLADMGRKNELLNKQLLFPPDGLTNLLSNIGKEIKKASTTIQDSNESSGEMVASIPTLLRSRFKDKDAEIYDDLIPIKNVQKFEKLEEDIEDKLEEFDEWVDRYSKGNKRMANEEVKMKIRDDGAVKNEVEIMSNFITWLRRIAADTRRK